MCIPYHQRARRERILMAIASVALCAGIALPYAVHPASGLNQDWFNGVRGLLFGISIGVNLFVARFGGRGRENTA